MKLLSKRLSLKHLKQDWLIYLIGMVFSIVFWVILFNIKFPVDSDLSINIFMSGQLTNQNFDQNIELHFNNDFDVNLVSIDDSNQGFYDKLSLIGLNTCEIIILPKEVAKILPLQNYMHLLTSDFIDAYFSDLDLEYFYQNEIPYGIKFESERMSWLNESFDFSNNEYYLFINDIALNDSNKINNSVIEVVRYLLGE